ncbi:ABC transporter substrate-binding protein [Candidatus Gottesmanbacteria bacterium CG11_big_fil_rev_8_21_14_0_20_37_11]|uniref:ABC transporter substrate-binding protein n=2 Tax=Candidatus Gottesmaniibacteriota TaxID=1752720 RepID=A0A1J4TU65_9BACT|nr:MAG: hypothetical protein AUJ73_01045 [Candidatus Gottesmanbacteria bacterium CG1_02_37_22]PIR07762.1 MAG: ABC transporter substrate-binding protein [Candidatus Gottesmanbacteria bacterium CG11_big_fil_rev_8_21_14_0_20_37_11]
MKKLILFLVILVGIAGVLLLTGKSNRENVKGKIRVSASFYPLAHFARQAGGNKIDVVQILPMGIEPHDFEPSPSDIGRIYNSNLFIYNGAGFEPWADKIVDDLEGKGVVILKMSDYFDLLKTDKDKTVTDPHIWVDPVNAKREMELISEALIKIDKSNENYYQEKSHEYISKLDILNKEMIVGLGDCSRNEIIVSHNAFSYLSKRYNFQTLSIAGISPDQEPSPRSIGETAKLAKEKNIKYIFFETLVSPKLSETLAKEVGAKTLVLNPVESLTSEEIAQNKDYISLMEDNIINLKLALSCK